MTHPLARTLAARLPSGAREAVLVVGSGLNRHACGGEEDWDALLDTVAGRIGASTGPAPGGSMTARWESLLGHLAGAEGLSASKAEARLQREVVAALGALEQSAAEHPFYGRLLDAGFRDIVSLNFDRRLPLHAKVRGLIVPARRRPRRDPSLFRHAVVRRNGVVTRIWYPHGDTASRSTLKLGVRSYGRYIAMLEWARRRHKARERRFATENGSRDAAWRAWLRSDEPDEPTWLDLLFTAPVVFVGCGLSADEWPLWWTLHQRARNMARTPAAERLPGHVLVAEGAPPHLAGGRADLEASTFPDFDQLWKTLLA